MNTLKKFERLIFIHEKSILIIICIVGLLLRLYGINFGLPYLYSYDESSFVVAAVKILANHDPNPHWFGHPASTQIYLLAAIYTTIFFIGKSLGIFANAEAFKSLFFNDPTVFYLSGRLLSAATGTAIILLTYLIGRKIFSKTIGFIASVLVAIIPLHIYFAKLVRADLTMTFIILLSLWFCLKNIENNSYINYMIASFLIGLAIVTKYPAIIFIFTIILTYILNKGWQLENSIVCMVSSILSCIAGAFLGSPFIFLDFKQVMLDIKHESRLTHLGATGEGLISNIIWYLQVIANNLTTLGFCLAIFGFFLCISSKQKDKWILISFPSAFLLFISLLNLRWERWIIPIVPFICLIFAYAIYKIASWVGEYLNSRLALLIILLLMLITYIPLLNTSIIQGREMSGVDTRTIARQWIINNIKFGSSLLTEAYTPQLPKKQFKFFEVKGGSVVETNPNSKKNEIFRPNIVGRIGKVENFEDISKKNIDYIIMSDMCDRYLMEKERYSSIAATCIKVMSPDNLIYEIESIPKVNRGPKIRIYKVKNNL